MFNRSTAQIYLSIIIYLLLSDLFIIYLFIYYLFIHLNIQKAKAKSTSKISISGCLRKNSNSSILKRYLGKPNT